MVCCKHVTQALPIAYRSLFVIKTTTKIANCATRNSDSSGSCSKNGLTRNSNDFPGSSPERGFVGISLFLRRKLRKQTERRSTAAGRPRGPECNDYRGTIISEIICVNNKFVFAMRSCRFHIVGLHLWKHIYISVLPRSVYHAVLSYRRYTLNAFFI